MTVRGDFTLIRFDKTLKGSDAPPTALPTFPVEPTGVLKASFKIDDRPLEGYVLLQVAGVRSTRHRIRINDKDLPNEDLFVGPASGWTTWFDAIPEGLLRPGANVITIIPDPNDSIAVGTVVVHWRET